jgi:hypothetical protein
MKKLYLTGLLSLALASSYATTPSIENFQSHTGGACFDIVWPEANFGSASISTGEGWEVDFTDYTFLIFIYVDPPSSFACGSDTLGITLFLDDARSLDEEPASAWLFQSCSLEAVITAVEGDPRRIRVTVGTCTSGGDPGGDPGTDPGGDPGTDPGTDPGDGGGEDPCADMEGAEHLACLYLQLIEPVCPCEIAWKNHGNYVSCVSQTAKRLQAAGVITSAEKEAIVTIAAESACGKK